MIESITLIIFRWTIAGAGNKKISENSQAAC